MWEEWLTAFKAAGHNPKLNSDGDVDWFFVDSGYHNGPGCTECSYSTCCHCTPAENIPACKSAAHSDTQGGG